MKKRNPTIVSVSCSKVDARERECQQLVDWLRTIPEGVVHDYIKFNEIMSNSRRAYDKLHALSANDLSVTVPVVTADYLVLFITEFTKRYGIAYVEFTPDEENGDHYSPIGIQHFDHPADAFRALQLRLASDAPCQAVKV